MLAGDGGEAATDALFDIDSFDGGDWIGVGVRGTDSGSSTFAGESSSGDFDSFDGAASPADD